MQAESHNGSPVTKGTPIMIIVSDSDSADLVPMMLRVCTWRSRLHAFRCYDAADLSSSCLYSQPQPSPPADLYFEATLEAESLGSCLLWSR